MIRLRYGDGQELHLDLPEEATVADFSGPRGQPLADPASAVAAALSDPVDYPALQRAVTPGDRVVLAIDRGVPQLAAVVGGAVHSLLGGSVSPEDIRANRSSDRGWSATRTKNASRTTYGPTSW
jgi:hypothetical protein